MNTRLLQKLNSIKHHSPLWMVVILLLVGFSGCSQSTTPPNAGYGGQTPPTNAGGIPAPPEANAGGIPAPGANTPPPANGKPPEKSAEKPAEKPKDPSAIALAEEILKNAKNPFLSKLPKIEPIVKIPDLESGKKDPGDPSSPDANPAFPFPKEPTMKSVPHAASDPFSEVVISGIVYSDKNPMALLSVASSGPNGGAVGVGNDGGNKIVKKGDRVQVSYGEIKVVNITPSTIEFADVANPRSHRILTIADIVGYDKTKNVPKGPEMPKFGTELPPPVQTELPPLKPRDGKNNPILSIPNVDFISGPPAPKKQSSENPGDSTAAKPPLKVGNFKVIGLEEP